MNNKTFPLTSLSFVWVWTTFFDAPTLNYKFKEGTRSKKLVFSQLVDERGWDILDCPFFFTKYQVRAFFRSKVPAVGGLLSFFLDACVCVYIFFIYKLFFDVFLHVTFIFFVLSKTRQIKNQDVCIYIYICGYICIFLYWLFLLRGQQEVFQ
jgi:hypothetical protein